MIASYEYGEAGPRVFLLHGGGGNADQWQEFAKHLDGFRLTAVDLPGHGGSSDSSWRWDEVLDELETLDLGNPFVVGHSLGGMLAVRWGKRHPECPGLVNLDGNGWPSTYPGLEDVEPAREKLNEVFKAQADAMAAPLAPEVEEMLVTQQPYLRRNLVRRNGQTFLRPECPALDVIREMIAAERTTDLYDGLSCPALAVVATRLFPAQEPFADLFRAQQRGVVENLRGREERDPGGCRVVEFDGSHGMLFEDPAGVAALVREFVTAH
ncbi:pimeloyl-ACP methyl ester carboxylesterase [Kribbella orskensis]|uniref:Pimeloyl-ACP methyl ester carboxylesterase n=1 Tax=Kribbella orskensis TaxID=2512216 RepID=A0ABY2BQF8_9ACTN|nr:MULTISPECIES: alpha/beta hydrolase [Kribbella]TCN37242.1 pimeloyl-ACP methyl ester carboxylesterase [Kribbella sp. VKM Ac-2500]TCO27850.1 pimeloyl-ACP methyl ester carboxylesterase [Kribbella orskensis]